MILITGGATIREEHRETALELGRQHSARSRGEPGCLSHDCHIDAANPNRIVFVERWTDMAAVRTHFTVPASGEFVQRLGAIAESRPDIQLYDAAELPSPLG